MTPNTLDNGGPDDAILLYTVVFPVIVSSIKLRNVQQSAVVLPLIGQIRNS